MTRRVVRTGFGREVRTGKPSPRLVPPPVEPDPVETLRREVADVASRLTEVEVAVARLVADVASLVALVREVLGLDPVTSTSTTSTEHDDAEPTLRVLRRVTTVTAGS